MLTDRDGQVLSTLNYLIILLAYLAVGSLSWFVPSCLADSGKPNTESSEEEMKLSQVMVIT